MPLFSPQQSVGAQEECTEAELRARQVAIQNCAGNVPLNCSLDGGAFAFETVYMLGDSITLQSEQALNDAFQASRLSLTAINADGGRAITSDTFPDEQTGTEAPDGLEAVGIDSQFIQNSDAIVVALGTNSGNENLPEQVPALVDKILGINPNIRLFWVNLFVANETTRNERNAQIEAALANYNQAQVIDLNDAGIELRTDDGGVHPTVAGNTTFAQAIVNRLESASSISLGESGTDEVKEIVGGQSLDGNPAHILSYLPGLDESAAANAINVYIEERKPESPFVGLGASFVAGGKKYNVNPFLAVGHLQIENGFATANGGWHNPSTLYATREAAETQDASQLGAESHNAFGREAGSSQPKVYYRTGSGRIRTPFQWSSWAASLDGNNGTEDPWFALINRRYLAIGEGSFNIESGDFAKYISHYAPGGDGNNEEKYVGLLFDAIDEMVSLAGSGVVFAGSAVGGCDTLQAGTNGWGLPGEPNPMVYYSQIGEDSSNNPQDPAVTSFWGDSAYGEGTIAQCGCGPASFAMIVATLRNDPTVNPENVAAWAAEKGYRSGDGDCAGSAWWWIGFPDETRERWGVVSRQITIEEAPALLRQGKLIMTSVGPGSPFLSEGGNGHLLVMRAVTNSGEFLFADPSDSISKRVNGGDGAEGVDPNIFNGNPPGSSHTPVPASVVSQGLKGLFVIELPQTGVHAE